MHRFPKLLRSTLDWLSMMVVVLWSLLKSRAALQLENMKVSGLAARHMVEQQGWYSEMPFLIHGLSALSLSSDSPQTFPLNSTTDLGYPIFRCRFCRRKFNERTGTPFNYLEYPTDIVFQVLLCRFRYKLSLRNLAELFLLCGFEFTPQAVQEWEARFASLLGEPLRRRRQGKVGARW